MKKEYEVKKVGWDKGNEQISIVLLSLDERQKLGINLKSVVKVKKKLTTTTSLESLAIVQKQFKDLVGVDCTSINIKVSEDLNVKVGEKVIITTEVLESEAKAFQEKMNNILRESFMNMMRGG